MIHKSRPGDLRGVGPWTPPASYAPAYTKPLIWSCDIAGRCPQFGHHLSYQWRRYQWFRSALMH